MGKGLFKGTYRIAVYSGVGLGGHGIDFITARSAVIEMGGCADCKMPGCICNQVLITRNSKPAGKIKFVLVGEELGL